MGNYRSRPSKNCSEELLRRILDSYASLQSKLEKDLCEGDNTHLNAIQSAVRYLEYQHDSYCIATNLL